MTGKGQNGQKIQQSRETTCPLGVNSGASETIKPMFFLILNMVFALGVPCSPRLKHQVPCVSALGLLPVAEVKEVIKQLLQARMGQDGH